MFVKYKKLKEDAVKPIKGTEGSAGFDLTAISIHYDEYGNIVYGTGLAFEIPVGYVGLLFPRSSICKKNMQLTDCVGVIDSDYRGEVTAKFKPTLGVQQPYYKTGEKCAQLIIIETPYIDFEESDILSETKRGVGSYGSTGN